MAIMFCKIVILSFMGHITNDFALRPVITLAKSKTEFSVIFLLVLLSPYSLYQLHFLKQRYGRNFKREKY